MIHYKRGYKYQLSRPVLGKVNVHPDRHVDGGYLSLRMDGSLTILAGYCWDGPSGPLPDRKRLMRAALVHDALYQLHRSGALPLNLREQSDAVFRDICIEDGVSKFVANIYYWGLRRFGGYAADPGNRKPVMVAPRGKG